MPPRKISKTESADAPITVITLSDGSSTPYRGTPSTSSVESPSPRSSTISSIRRQRSETRDVQKPPWLVFSLKDPSNPVLSKFVVYPGCNDFSCCIDLDYAQLLQVRSCYGAHFSDAIYTWFVQHGIIWKSPTCTCGHETEVIASHDSEHQAWGHKGKYAKKKGGCNRRLNLFGPLTCMSHKQVEKDKTGVTPFQLLTMIASMSKFESAESTMKEMGVSHSTHFNAQKEVERYTGCYYSKDVMEKEQHWKNLTSDSAWLSKRGNHRGARVRKEQGTAC